MIGAGAFVEANLLPYLSGLNARVYAVANRTSSSFSRLEAVPADPAHDVHRRAARRSRGGCRAHRHQARFPRRACARRPRRGQARARREAARPHPRRHGGGPREGGTPAGRPRSGSPVARRRAVGDLPAEALQDAAAGRSRCSASGERHPRPARPLHARPGSRAWTSRSAKNATSSISLRFLAGSEPAEVERRLPGGGSARHRRRTTSAGDHPAS